MLKCSGSIKSTAELRAYSHYKDRNIGQAKRDALRSSSFIDLLMNIMKYVNRQVKGKTTTSY